MLTAAALMVLGVVLGCRPETRAPGPVGLVAIAVGLAAGRAAGTATPAPAEFLAVNAGLELLGLLLVAAALARSSHGSRGIVTRTGVAAGALGVLLGFAAAVPLVREAGLPRVAVVAAGLALAGAGVGRLGRWSGISRLVRRRSAPPLALAPAPVPLAALAAGALAVAAAPHIGIVLAGAVVGAWAAWAAAPRSRRGWPLAAGLATVLLALAVQLLSAIAGPEGLAIRQIPALPMSPAAEVLIAPLVLGGAWALTGLWPLRQPLGGTLTAPIAALLLLRVALPAVPAGLEHWRPAAFPVVLLGLWHAALTGRLSTLAVGGAALGLASARREGVVGALWLLASALAVELAARAPAREGRLTRVAHAAIALAAGWGVLLVLEAGLGTETVYTVIGAAAAAAAVAARPCVDPPGSRVHIAASV